MNETRGGIGSAAVFLIGVGNGLLLAAGLQAFGSAAGDDLIPVALAAAVAGVCLSVFSGG